MGTNRRNYTRQSDIGNLPFLDEGQGMTQQNQGYYDPYQQYYGMQQHQGPSLDYNHMFDQMRDYYDPASNIGHDIGKASLAANTLSSQNAQARYYPEAMVQQAQLALEMEKLKQQGQNQRLGMTGPLLAALFGGGAGGGSSMSMAGGHGGGFTSNFGQSVH